jgi:atypical dual specificity phosphatase
MSKIFTIAIVLIALPEISNAQMQTNFSRMGVDSGSGFEYVGASDVWTEYDCGDRCERYVTASLPSTNIIKTYGRIVYTGPSQYDYCKGSFYNGSTWQSSRADVPSYVGRGGRYYYMSVTLSRGRVGVDLTDEEYMKFSFQHPDAAATKGSRVFALATQPDEPCNFSWVGSLHDIAGMAEPGLCNSVDNDLKYLAQQHVDALVTLTTTPTDAVLLAKYGIEGIHIPIVDYTPPSLAQMQLYVAELTDVFNENGKVVVHCHAGCGRAGTMLAVYFVAFEGMTADDAIDHIRDLRPCSIETSAQENAVHTYYNSL